MTDFKITKPDVPIEDIVPKDVRDKLADAGYFIGEVGRIFTSHTEVSVDRMKLLGMPPAQREHTMMHAEISARAKMCSLLPAEAFIKEEIPSPTHRIFAMQLAVYIPDMPSANKRRI